jgi:sensor domain CHASE-containing protein
MIVRGHDDEPENQSQFSQYDQWLHNTASNSNSQQDFVSGTHPLNQSNRSFLFTIKAMLYWGVDWRQ